jgi:hypothetical protein
MGSGAIGLWEQAVKVLQQLTQDPASCANETMCEVAAALGMKLQRLSPAPKATWKKLVQQRQVR